MASNVPFQAFTIEVFQSLLADWTGPRVEVDLLILDDYLWTLDLRGPRGRGVRYPLWYRGLMSDVLDYLRGWTRLSELPGVLTGT